MFRYSCRYKDDIKYFSLLRSTIQLSGNFRALIWKPKTRKTWLRRVNFDPDCNGMINMKMCCICNYKASPPPLPTSLYLVWEIVTPPPPLLIPPPHPPTHYPPPKQRNGTKITKRHYLCRDLGRGLEKIKLWRNKKGLSHETKLTQCNTQSIGILYQNLSFGTFSDGHYIS